MSPILPPAVQKDPGTTHHVFNWTIPASLDGKPLKIHGTLNYVPPPSSSSPRWWLLAVLLTLAVVGGAAAFFLYRRQPACREPHDRDRLRRRRRAGAARGRPPDADGHGRLQRGRPRRAGGGALGESPLLGASFAASAVLLTGIGVALALYPASVWPPASRPTFFAQILAYFTFTERIADPLGLATKLVEAVGIVVALAMQPTPELEARAPLVRARLRAARRVRRARRAARVRAPPPLARATRRPARRASRRESSFPSAS